MGETVLVIILEWTVRQTGMIGDQLQVATNGLADGSQAAEVPIDREAFQVDGIGPQVFPELGPSRRIHLSIDAHLHDELGPAGLDGLQQKGRRDGHVPNADVAQPIEQPHKAFLPRASPLVISLARAIQ